MIRSQKIALSVLSAILLGASASCGGNNANNNELSESEPHGTGEQFLRQNATAEELESLNLGSRPLSQRAQQSIRSEQNAAAVRAKRSANVSKALEYLRQVRALPHSTVIQVDVKCQKISEAVAYLKSINSPLRPFDGLRGSFRHALKNQRIDALKKVGVVSCGKVKNIVASLPPAAPVPAIVADEAVPAVDTIDADVAVAAR